MINTQYIFHRYFIGKVNEVQGDNVKSGINVIADFKELEEEKKEEEIPF